LQSWESIQVLSQMAITSEYFLQVTLDKTGNVLSSDSSTGPVPTLFDKKKKSIHFKDCFLSSDWSKYENQRIKASKSNHQSFFVELHKIDHLEESTTLTKWEFFFVSKDFTTCLGIGHPVEPTMPYSLGLGEFIDGYSGKSEVLDSLLENKLLGFWEYDLEKKEDLVSSDLAQLLGHKPEELDVSFPVSWQKYIHPEDFPSIKRELKTHFQTPENLPFKMEFRLLSKNNEVTWVIGFGKTSKWSEEGLPTRIQGLLIDISEKKKQELWLREHHYFLKDLAFQQSHSLRARVANIWGIMEIIETEGLSEETRKLLSIMKKEVKMLDDSLKKSIKESVQQNEIIEKGMGSSGSIPS
jgi:PAS domain S-box-containing protein